MNDLIQRIADVTEAYTVRGDSIILHRSVDKADILAIGAILGAADLHRDIESDDDLLTIRIDGILASAFETQFADSMEFFDDEPYVTPDMCLHLPRVVAYAMNSMNADVRDSTTVLTCTAVAIRSITLWESQGSEISYDLA